MELLKNSFGKLAVIITCIPGFTILYSNIIYPPEPGFSKWIFMGVSQSLSCFALYLLWINKEKISQKSTKNINKLSFILIICFLLFLFIYNILFRHFVLSSQYGDVCFPLWNSYELSTSIAELGSKQAVLDKGVQFALNKIESNSFSLTITNFTFLIIYCFVFINLVLAFGLLGIKNIAKNKSIKLK